MERRDTNRAADSAVESSKLENSKAWQAVRRALGRLVSRVGVRTVEDAERTIPAPVRRVELALPPPVLSHGDAWQPAATVCRAAVPQAGIGMQESDLLPAAILAQGDYALSPPTICAMPVADSKEIGIENAPLEWPVGVTHLPESFVRLPSSPVRIGTAALLPLPKTKPLRAWEVERPPVISLRPPRLAEPRVRWGGDSVLRRMPLSRRSRGIPANILPTAAFTVERRRLAETAHLSADEVTLLGVYPDVPILAVERIVVEDEGSRLKLWLKPDVLRGRTASHRITLLVGRQNSTGKMLQAAL